MCRHLFAIRVKPLALSLATWFLFPVLVWAQTDLPEGPLTLARIPELAAQHSPLIAAAKSRADSLHSGAEATRDALGLRITSSAGILFDPVEEKRLIARSRPRANFPHSTIRCWTIRALN